MLSGSASARTIWIRPVPSAAVVGVSQACSLVVLLVLLPFFPTPASWGWLPWSIVAGLAGSLSLVLFYRALAYGTVGVVLCASIIARANT